MQANNPGKWEVGCRIDDHRKSGMFASYFVNSTCGNKTEHLKLDGKIRRYFIAAEKVVWNYAPSGYNAYDGEWLNKTGRLVIDISASGIYFGSPFGRYPTFHTMMSAV